MIIWELLKGKFIKHSFKIKKLYPKTQIQLLNQSVLMINYFLASLAALYLAINSSATAFGTLPYFSNSIVNSPLP